ncbi:transcriptional regulator PpsR [uncultured Nevskia sp.]|uniref:transcriptional regulator PpsR n=1 Tax=uncultured Nevskia sp. TaxID=228950 RepID=UPI0025E2CAF1|nr:transcriptional regulator PpsR [uncultured Nevskia sp.]
MTLRDPHAAQDLGALSALAPELAEMLVSVASDIALVIDDQGVIQRIALGGSEPVKTMADEWVGRHMADTVTIETRKKVEQLLADVAATGLSRSRQVNHPSPLGLDVPMAYSAVRLGQSGPLLVVGRDLSVVSAMQQRLVHAQAEMEREYWQRRQSETRYQLLFQIATDAVLVVDATSLNVIDANRAAARLFGLSLDQLIGKRATVPLHEESREAVLELFASAKLNGRAAETDAVLPEHRGMVRVSITPLRTEASTALLMRLKSIDPQWQPQAAAKLQSLMAMSPDAIVVTDADGLVQMANPAFTALAQVEAPSAVVGRSLGEWLGVTADDLALLMNSLRRDAVAQRIATTVRGEQGRLIAVELSGTCLREDDEESFGFILRPGYGSGAVRMPGLEPPDPSIH